MTITSAKGDSASYSSAADKENVEFSPMKKCKVDEEDDVDIESETTESSEEGEGAGYYNNPGGGGIYYNPVVSEPEWDVDSFDGREYESDSDNCPGFSDDEDYKSWRAERVKSFQHKGFLPDRWIGIYPIKDLDDGPGYRHMTSNREFLTFMVSLCVKKHNEEKGENLEFVSIVRGNMKGAFRMKLYITFMAREYPDGPLVEYQAKAMDFFTGRPPFPILCRRAPNPTI